MIKVTIELESAITGETTKIGQMHIWNDGRDLTNDRKGSYDVAVLRRGQFDAVFGTVPANPARTGHVENYPRLSYNVWRLVSRALRSAFPEER